MIECITSSLLNTVGIRILSMRLTGVAQRIMLRRRQAQQTGAAGKHSNQAPQASTASAASGHYDHHSRHNMAIIIFVPQR